MHRLITNSLKRAYPRSTVTSTSTSTSRPHRHSTINKAKDWCFRWWVLEEWKQNRTEQNTNLNPCRFCTEASCSRQQPQEGHNTAQYQNLFLHSSLSFSLPNFCFVCWVSLSDGECCGKCKVCKQWWIVAKKRDSASNKWGQKLRRPRKPNILLN